MSALNEESQKVMAKIKSTKLDWKKVAGAIVAVVVAYEGYSLYNKYYDDGMTTVTGGVAADVVACIRKTANDVRPQIGGNGSYDGNQDAQPDADSSMVVTNDSANIVRVYANRERFTQPIAVFSANRVETPSVKTSDRALASLHYTAAKDCLTKVVSDLVTQTREASSNQPTGFAPPVATAAPSTPAIGAAPEPAAPAATAAPTTPVFTAPASTPALTPAK